MNNVSVIEVSKCGLAHGTLLGEHVLALILRMMAGGLLKTVSNWVVLTVRKLNNKLPNAPQQILMTIQSKGN